MDQRASRPTVCPFARRLRLDVLLAVLLVVSQGLVCHLCGGFRVLVQKFSRRVFPLSFERPQLRPLHPLSTTRTAWHDRGCSLCAANRRFRSVRKRCGASAADLARLTEADLKSELPAMKLAERRRLVDAFTAAPIPAPASAPSSAAPASAHAARK